MAVSELGGKHDTPEEYTHKEDAEFLAMAAGIEADYTPEQLEDIHAVEGRVDWYRYEAIHAPLPEPQKRGFLSGVLGVTKRVVKPALHDLVEHESTVGGEMFAIPSRFWLQPQDSASHGTRDWYFHFTRAQQDHTIHYQTSESAVTKIYDGREYPLTHGEGQRFVNAVTTYEKDITEKVYRRTPVVRVP